MADTNEPNARSLQSRKNGHNNGRDKKNRNDQRPHYDFDEDTNEKLREIEASGEPLSIAESISREYGGRLKASDLQSNGEASKQEHDVTDLQRMSIDELVALAATEGIDNTEELPRHKFCLLYTSPSPRDATLSRMPSSA